MRNHRPARVTMLALLLVGILWLVGGDVWAESKLPTLSSYTDFPFLALTKTQWQYMLSGFRLQWVLFGSFGGANASALYFLALTATLVGALMIVFQKKNQSLMVVGPWLFLVVALLFSPYKSRLFFYPIEKQSTCEAVSVSQVSGNSLDGKTCGFTPQVLAAHLGSSLNLLFYDLFRSQGWENAIQNAELMSGLENDPYLNNAKVQDQDAYARYAKECSQAPSQAKPDTTNATPTAGAKSHTLQSVVTGSIKDFYGKPSDASTKEKSGLGPAVGLYTDKPSFMSDLDWQSYQKKLGVLYKAVTGDEKAVLDQTSSSTDKITIKDGVTKIIAAMNVGVGAAPGPWATSFFFLPVGADGTPDATVASTFLTNRDNYSKSKGYSAHDNFVDAWNNKSSDPRDLGWLRSTALPDELQSMPVASVKLYPKQVCAPDTCANPGQCGSTCKDMVETDPAKAFKVQTANDCETRGKQITQDAMQHMFGSPFKQLDSLWLETGGTTPGCVASHNCTSDDFCEGCSAQQLATAAKIAAWVNQTGGMGMIKDKLGEIVNGNIASALMRKNNPQMQAAGAPSPSAQGSILGSSFNPGGWVGDIGKLLTGVAGYISGIKALATITVLRMLVDMGIMALLILTPLLFIMGVLVPTNATGLLFVTTVGMLVFKLVPVTMLLIDAMASLVMSGLNATNAGWLDGFSSRGALLYAVAGMYSGVIGLTMFIMFKIGSPQNIGQLQSLDKAAGEIADAGKKGAIAAASIAAAAITGGAVGALGAVMKSAGVDPEVAKLGKQMAEGDKKEKKPPKTPEAEGGVPPVPPNDSQFGVAVGEKGEDAGDERAQAMGPMTPEEQALHDQDLEHPIDTETGNAWEDKITKERTAAADLAARTNAAVGDVIPGRDAGEPPSFLSAKAPAGVDAATWNAMSQDDKLAHWDSMSEADQNAYVQRGQAEENIDTLTDSPSYKDMEIRDPATGANVPVADYLKKHVEFDENGEMRVRGANGQPMTVGAFLRAQRDGRIASAQKLAGAGAAATGAADGTVPSSATGTPVASGAPGDTEMVEIGRDALGTPIMGTRAQLAARQAAAGGVASGTAPVASGAPATPSGAAAAAPGVPGTTAPAAPAAATAPAAGTAPVAAGAPPAAGTTPAAAAATAPAAAPAAAGNTQQQVAQSTLGEVSQAVAQGIKAGMQDAGGVFQAAADKMAEAAKLATDFSGREVERARAGDADGGKAGAIGEAQISAGWNNLSTGSKAARGALSGFMGAIGGMTGGLGKIPILGDVMREVKNEWTQAPVRARAMYAAGYDSQTGEGKGVLGSFMAYRRDQKDAYEASFYSKELGAISAGQAHRDLREKGHLFDQFENARNSGMQSAAQVIAQYEGRKNAMHTTGNKMNVDDYFRTQILGSMQQATDANRLAITVKEGNFHVEMRDAEGKIIKDASGNVKYHDTLVGMRQVAAGKALMSSAGAMETPLQDYQTYLGLDAKFKGLAKGGKVLENDAKQVLGKIARDTSREQAFLAGMMDQYEELDDSSGMRSARSYHIKAKEGLDAKLYASRERKANFYDYREFNTELSQAVQRSAAAGAMTQKLDTYARVTRKMDGGHMFKKTIDYNGVKQDMQSAVGEFADALESIAIQQGVRNTITQRVMFDLLDVAGENLFVGGNTKEQFYRGLDVQELQKSLAKMAAKKPDVYGGNTDQAKVMKAFVDGIGAAGGHRVVAFDKGDGTTVQRVILTEKGDKKAGRKISDYSA